MEEKKIKNPYKVTVRFKNNAELIGFVSLSDDPFLSFYESLEREERLFFGIRGDLEEVSKVAFINKAEVNTFLVEKIEDEQ